MNDSRRPDPMREVCEELAELLASEDGARTASLLHLTATVDGPAGTSAEPAEPAPQGPVPISIWQPVERGGERVFVRPEASPLGDHHAARREIPARKEAGVLRVAFFGESVAAGYLYAPHLTPAGALERLLDHGARARGAPQAGGPGRYEVVDLARTDETLDSLAATVAASLQLDPDVFVVFAGNNWNLLETPEVSPYFPSLRGRRRYALALRRGLGGPVTLARRELRLKVEGALAAIAEHARGRPVVLVLPEVNLADWPEKQPVPWLPGDGTARWYRLYEQTREALGAGSFREAAGLAARMAELDGGLCPTSELLRARVREGLGDPDGARRAFEAQVGQGSYATAAFLGSPRASAEARDLLRRAAARHGFRTVDLPRVFARHTGSPLPGRRLFLDYCHLTREGIAVAMSAVAAEVLGDGAVPAPETVEVPAAAEAVARLGAAIHGAHRLAALDGKGPWLETWLREALDADPEIAGTFLGLAAARCAPCPEVLTPAQHDALATPYRLLLQHGWRWDHLDADLLRALATVLEERGLPAREEIHRQLLEHHDVGTSGRDLARPPYLWDPVERFYPEAMDSGRRAFYRAAWPESSFCLVADGRRDVELDVTLRLPAVEGTAGSRTGEPRTGASRTGAVEVRLDGRPAGTIPATAAWERRSLRLPKEDLRSVLHRLTLRWPMPPALGDLALTGARRRLEVGTEADVHPVFGEVFSLVARAGS